MKVVAILSGGMDSTTLVYDLVSSGHEVFCISFNYGQKHIKELIASMITTNKLQLPHEVVDLSSISHLINNSALTSNISVPEGHYTDDNMKATVVPNRNMIMLSIAAGYAINIGAVWVAYGAHAGDHTIYPDCRGDFVKAMNHAFSLCDFKPLSLYVPYLNMHKGEVCARGAKLSVPYKDTWTCYKGQEKPCGVCGSCVERAEAFDFANRKDPLCNL